eukprot:scaffold2601_cov117-Isochrysis_galbana.AAC.2
MAGFAAARSRRGRGRGRAPFVDVVAQPANLTVRDVAKERTVVAVKASQQPDQRVISRPLAPNGHAGTLQCEPQPRLCL